MTRAVTPSSSISTVAILAALALGAAACTPVVATRGHMADPERLAEIKVGTSRQDDVAGILGSPSQVGTFDPNVWYYIGQKTEKVAFYEPDVIERRVVVIHFDNGGVVKDLKVLDASAGKDVEIVDRTTPTSGRELGILEQLLGNVGRFGGKSPSTKGPGG